MRRFLLRYKPVAKFWKRMILGAKHGHDREIVFEVLRASRGHDWIKRHVTRLNMPGGCSSQRGHLCTCLYNVSSRLRILLTLARSHDTLRSSFLLYGICHPTQRLIAPATGILAIICHCDTLLSIMGCDAALAPNKVNPVPTDPNAA